MFDSYLFHCLELDPETGKWRLVESVETQYEGANYVGWAELGQGLYATRLVVGYAGDCADSSAEVYNDGRYRLRVFRYSNNGKIKQPEPPRVTAEIVAVIEKEYPKRLAAELAARERRQEREEWEEADRQMIRRERALMEEEWRSEAERDAE